MILLKDCDPLALQAVLIRLREKAPKPDPESKSLVTEEGRLEYAEAKGRYNLVRELELALKPQGT